MTTYTGKLTFDIQKNVADPEEAKFCDGNLNYYNMDYQNVVELEGALLGAIAGLGAEVAAKKAGQ